MTPVPIIWRWQKPERSLKIEQDFEVAQPCKCDGFWHDARKVIFLTFPILIGSLSTRVFETRTATESELFLPVDLSSHNHIYIAEHLFSIRDD